MKQNFSSRERWIAAITPTLVIAGIYGFFVVDGLTADLDKQEKRIAAASAPVTPPAASPTLARAKINLDELKKKIAEREERVAGVEARLVSRKSSAVESASDPAQVIEKVESIFTRHGLTTLLSAADGEGHSGCAPSALVTVLSGSDSDKSRARVWHCIFDNQPARFDLALKDLIAEAPGVVPVSLNYVYNPDNDGETRLLELWLIY